MPQEDRQGVGTLLQFWNRWEEGLNAADVEQVGPFVRIRFSLITDLPRFTADMRRMLQRGQADANKVRSQTNLGVLARAMTSYHDKLDRLIQAARYGKDRRPLLSWRVFLLPFLGQIDLFNEFNLDEPWDGPHNRRLLDRMPYVFRSPTDTSLKPTTTYYQVFVGKGTLFEDRAGLAVTRIPKGADKTLLIVEGGQAVPWTKPQDLEYDPARPLPKLGGAFGDGCCAVLLDGKPRWLPRTIDEKALRALISRHQSHTVDLGKLP
jgi:hypothetical protein